MEMIFIFISNDKEEAKEGYDINKIDLGIAMCHFDLTCKELGINGDLK